METEKSWTSEKSAIGLYNLVKREKGKVAVVLARNVVFDKAVDLMEADMYGGGNEGAK